MDNKYVDTPEAWLESTQTFMMEPFTRIDKRLKAL